MGEVEVEIDAGKRKKLYDEAISLLERAGEPTAERQRQANKRVAEIKKILGLQWLRDFKA